MRSHSVSLTLAQSPSPQHSRQQPHSIGGTWAVIRLWGGCPAFTIRLGVHLPSLGTALHHSVPLAALPPMVQVRPQGRALLLLPVQQSAPEVSQVGAGV